MKLSVLQGRVVLIRRASTFLRRAGSGLARASARMGLTEQTVMGVSCEGEQYKLVGSSMGKNI